MTDVNHDTYDHTGIPGVGGFPAGTSFPVSPSADDLFFRTDRHLLYFYDGARWLTAQVFTMELPSSGGQTASFVLGRLPSDPAYDVYIEDFFWAAQVGTTNNGSNYWEAALYREGGGLQVGSTLTTSADSLNTYTFHSATISTAYSGVIQWRVSITKVGTPGPVYSGSRVRYRLVG